MAVHIHLLGRHLWCGLCTPYFPARQICVPVGPLLHPFYIYLYCCYQNYILFYEKVENAFLEDITLSETENSVDQGEHIAEDIPMYHASMEKRIQD